MNYYKLRNIKYQNNGYYSILSDKDNNYSLEVDTSNNNVSGENYECK